MFLMAIKAQHRRPLPAIGYREDPTLIRDAAGLVLYKLIADRWQLEEI